MRLTILLLVLLSGCRVDYEEGWAKAHDYTLTGPGTTVPAPTIGPLLCKLGYQGKYFHAIRLPVPEERCGNGIKVLLLVCCNDRGDCYGQERDRSCGGVFAGE